MYLNIVFDLFKKFSVLSFKGTGIPGSLSNADLSLLPFYYGMIFILYFVFVLIL